MTSPHAPADEEFRFVNPPTPILPGRPKIGRPGIAEIKPHTASGIARGVRQLVDRPGDPERWLVTYLAEPMTSKKPRHVRVLAYLLKPKNGRGPKKEKRQWERMGPWELRPRGQLSPKVIPAMIPFPSTDNPGFFGMAIEDCVRDVFTPYLPHGSRVKKGTGGASWGPDVDWKELADFYAELAGETADPFFEELAAELSALVDTLDGEQWADEWVRIG